MNQIAAPGVIEGGEVAPLVDPPGALAEDIIDPKRRRARRCWPRGRLGLPKAALAVVLLWSLVGTSITLTGIRAALKEETLDSAAADAIKLNGTRETDQVGDKGPPGSLKVEEGGVVPPSKSEGRFVHNITAQHDSEGKIARAGSGVAKAEAASKEETVDSAATDVQELNERRKTDQVDEKRISPEASTSLKSKHAMEIRDSRSPVKPLLIADFKWTEGVNAQLVTLGTFLAVANATGRELLLVPFRSDHYVNHTTGRADHYIRMEDYFDNSPGAWPGWRTADPHDGSAPNIVRSLLQWRGYPNINQTVEKAEGSKGCVHARVITSLHPWKVDLTPFEDVVKAINAVPDEEAACVVGRTGRSKETPIPDADFFELNTLARKLSQRGLAAIRAGAALAPDAKLSAVHLIRGDKCGGRDNLVAGEKARCGPAAGLPFMNLCAELREKGEGLYVATDEKDRSFLEALKDGGCFVREDLGIDFVAESEAANDERGADGWRSVHPQALEFVIEMNIVRHAKRFYTMDRASSSLANVKSYRAHHGLSKPRIFSDETTMAAATSRSAHLKKDNGPVATIGDRGKNHTELVQQKNSSRKIHFQTTHKM